MFFSMKFNKLKFYLRKTWKEELRKAEVFNNDIQKEQDEMMEVRLQNRKEHSKSVENAKKLHSIEIAGMRKEHVANIENAYEKYDEMYEDYNLVNWSSPQKFKRVSAQMKVNRKLHAEMLHILQEEKRKAEEELRMNAEIIEALENSEPLENESLVGKDILMEATAKLTAIAAEEAALIEDKYVYLLQRLDESETVDEELELKKSLACLDLKK